MLFETLLGFALTSFVIELTPGPNMAYLAVVAATEGRRPALSAVAGVALGLGLVGLGAALGLAAAISASDLMYQGLRWGGVVYLLWLAWDGWHGADEAVAHAPPGSTNWRYFRRGLVTNLLNPKAAVFYVAVLPGFLLTPKDVLRETLLLTVIYVTVATAVHATIAVLAGTARALFEHPARERALRRTLSLVLATIAFWFAWKTGR
jgi:threonine/homoserine/homoserine lactone efflux protein